MVDYKLDSHFRVVRTNWGAFKTVEGLAEFEQELATELDERMSEILGVNGTRNTIKEKIELAVNRIARDFGVIDRVENLVVTPVNNDRYKVEILYVTAEPFEEIF